MNERKLSDMAWMMAFAFFILFGCLLMCSCVTPKTVKEYITIHDTLMTYKTDTVKDVKVVTKIDTVKQVEKHTYTINNVGDTVKEIHHYHDTEKVIVVDSTERYKATVDSLRKALVILANKEVVKTKPSQMWWKLPLTLAGFAVLILGGLWAYSKLT